MSTPNPQSLADAMKTGFEDRPSNRLSSMATTEQPAPFAVPLDQDAYEVALDHIEPDVVHIMADGRIVKTGGPDLALEVERDGYAGILAEVE